MSGGFLWVLVLVAFALFLRARAHRLVVRSARPGEIVHIDTGRNDQTLTSHRHHLTGRPDYILEEHGERPCRRHTSSTPSPTTVL